MDTSEILAELKPSVPRRTFGAIVLYGLAFLLLWLSFAGSFPALARIFLLVLAIGVFLLAERQRHVWGQTIYLTEAGLFTSEGKEIAALDQIKSVDRGLLAFKPSQGFILRLKDRHSFNWSPGLWWRNGRRAGIGGITPAGQGKFMAERLAILLKGEDFINPFSILEAAEPPEQSEPETEDESAVEDVPEDSEADAPPPEETAIPDESVVEEHSEDPEPRKTDSEN